MAATMSFGTSGTSQEELPQGVKRCPRCGEVLFDDMRICYGCLYDFGRKPYRPPEGLDVTPLPSSSPEDQGQDDGAGLPWSEPMESPESPRVEEVGHVGDSVESDADTTMSLAPASHVITVQTSEVDFAVPVPPEGLVVGRDPSCDIVLHSRAVSRSHVRITPAGSFVSVRDLASTNPATFGGKPVRSVVNLRPGEWIDICGYKMVVARSEGGTVMCA